MKKILFLMIFISLQAHSGTDIRGKTIKEISMGWGGEAVYIRVNEDMQPAEGCDRATFLLLPDTPFFNENFTIILSAFHAGSTLGFYVHGCSGKDMILKAVRLTK